MPAPRRRIGREPRTDFFTATSLGPVFGELVVAAVVTLLGPRPPGDHTFVEIGAEPGGPGRVRRRHPGRSGNHPFAARRDHPAGTEPGAASARRRLFQRAVRRATVSPPRAARGAWRETGVALRSGGLEEIVLPETTPEVRAMPDRLPADAPDGYRIDLPLAAGEARRPDRRPAVGRPVPRVRLRQVLARTRRRYPGRHGASLSTASADQRPARPARRAGPHLSCVLGLDQRSALGSRLWRTRARIPGGVLCAPRRTGAERADGGGGRPVQ